MEGHIGSDYPSLLHGARNSDKVESALIVAKGEVEMSILKQ